MPKALVAFATAIMLCASAASAAIYPKVLTGNATVSLKPDDDFFVALAANPTTGYSWTASSSDKNVVAVEGSAYRAPSGKALGAGGEQIMGFEAAHPGTATITLRYARPWEKGAKAAQTVIITVHVVK